MQIKKRLTSFVALWMAVLVLYGGAGVNIISFCCQECRSAGTEAVLLAKCCEIHQHQPDASTHTPSESKSNHDHACDHTGVCRHTAHVAEARNHSETQHNASHDHTSDEGCNMTRIDFDWSVQTLTELEIDLSPIALDILHHELFVDASIIVPIIHQSTTVMSNGPPLDTPRDYLSVLTVLLI